MDKQFLRVGEAAQALHVSRWTIYRWVKEGRLESARIGNGCLRIKRASVVALIDRGRTASGRPLPQGAGERTRPAARDTRQP